MAILRAENLTKRFVEGDKERTLFKNLSIEVPSGTFLGLVGPSGSGKSTLLNILSSLDHPTSGNVYIKNRCLNQFNKSQLASLRNSVLGFVFQTPHHVTTKTVLENVLLPLQYKGSKMNREDLEYGAKLLDQVGLGHCLNRFPNHLSGGELQRMVFARAIIRQPEVIFADEPTGSLDKENSHILLALLKREAKAGKTVIMSSHDPLAIDYCNHCIELDK